MRLSTVKTDIENAFNLVIVAHDDPIFSVAERDDALAALARVNAFLAQCEAEQERTADLRRMLRRVLETCHLSEDDSLQGDIERLLANPVD